MAIISHAPAAMSTHADTNTPNVGGNVVAVDFRQPPGYPLQDHADRPLPIAPDTWILAHVATARRPDIPITLQRDAPGEWIASGLGFAGCVIHDDEIMPGWRRIDPDTLDLVPERPADVTR